MTASTILWLEMTPEESEHQTPQLSGQAGDRIHVVSTGLKYAMTPEESGS